MQAERKTFGAFLALHAHKAPPTEEPCAYLQFANTTLTPATPLICFTRENVVEELDASSELVRWLLHQMSTYECTKQRIVALVFDRQTVLSEVLRIA